MTGVNAVSEVVLPIEDECGVRGELVIKMLPRSTRRVPQPVAPLIDERENPGREPSLEPVQLLEAEEYLYEIRCAPPAETITTDQEGFFFPDDTSGRRGRLRTGMYTGAVTVTFYCDDHRLGTAAFEVRSRKLDYLSHYRWMLRDIAEGAAELIMQSFAPAEQRFTADETGDASTLYQRFAFLRSIVEDEALEDAITYIAHRPHRMWVDTSEWRCPNQPIPVASTVVRQLTRPGPRVRSGGGAGVISYPLPAKLEVIRTEETLDTEPNRFVRFALLQWRRLVEEIGEALRNSTGNNVRAAREVREVLGRLDEYLRLTNFPGVSPLTRFPADNVVLQRAEGYQTVFRFYLQVEMAARLAWSGGDDVYKAGQRDIATLYEYWVYFQLVNIVARLSGARVDLRSLLDTSDDGLSLDLRKGRQRVIRGTVERLGRRLCVEFWFNKEFLLSRSETWTRAMRPDFSLRITPVDFAFRYADTWIHFDAKYRVETIAQLFGMRADEPPEAEPASVVEAGGAPFEDLVEPDAALPDGPEESSAADGRFGDAEEASTGRPLRADLLKMHAYKDAIRHSSGAYVIYPGTEEECQIEYHEILPGLGAFPLRPTKEGVADGANVLTRFIEDVILHVASQVTQHERGLYWIAQAYSGEPPTQPVMAVPFLTKPPADTLVLLGYVKSEAHLNWIKKTGRYNLRADGRTGSVGLEGAELGAEFVLLYGGPLEEAELWRVVDSPQLLTRQRMLELEYPEPRSEVYICLPVVPVMGEWHGATSTRSVEELKKRVAPAKEYGAPVVTTWLEVSQETGLKSSGRSDWSV